VQRESLVLLCESLELLGDRYAIYGFSGYTQHALRAVPVKAFDEPTTGSPSPHQRHPPSGTPAWGSPSAT